MMDLSSHVTSRDLLEDWVSAFKPREALCACGEVAAHQVTYLFENPRSNPASSGYRRDDISWCKDTAVFSCEKCVEALENSPDVGMVYNATFRKCERFLHLFEIRPKVNRLILDALVNDTITFLEKSALKELQ